MKSSLMKILKIISFTLFLSSFGISFYIPTIYKEIIFLEFMVLAPLAIFANYRYRILSQTYQVFCILLTGLTLLLGVPGSALGYFISASIGLFVAHNNFLNNKKCRAIDINLFIATTLFLISAGCYLLYLNFKSAFSHELAGSYFGTASINYASITIASFCSIFAVWCIRRKALREYLSPRQDIVLRIISGLLCATIVFTSINFGTRSAILGFIPPLLYAIQPKKISHVIAIVLVSSIMISIFTPGFSDFIVSFIVPGRNNLLELYSTELVGQERSQSAFAIFERAIPFMSMCSDCSDYLSYSGIANLVALSFPFSLFFVYKIISFISGYLFYGYYLLRANTLSFLIIIFSFINSFALTIFQADFLSMVSLFYVIGSGLMLSDSKVVHKR